MGRDKRTPPDDPEDPTRRTALLAMGVSLATLPVFYKIGKMQDAEDREARAAKDRLNNPISPAEIMLTDISDKLRAELKRKPEKPAGKIVDLLRQAQTLKGVDYVLAQLDAAGEGAQAQELPAKKSAASDVLLLKEIAGQLKNEMGDRTPRIVELLKRAQDVDGLDYVFDKLLARLEPSPEKTGRFA